jgi:hypothetical protein
MVGVPEAEAEATSKGKEWRIYGDNSSVDWFHSVLTVVGRSDSNFSCD